MQRFDEQCRNVTRKLDTFSLPEDLTLEQGVKPRKDNGKKKKKPAAEPMALVKHEPSPASVVKEPSLGLERRQCNCCLCVRKMLTCGRLNPRKNPLRKQGGNQAGELQQRVDVLTKFNRLSLLLDSMKPSFEALQRVLSGLPPEQRERQWRHPMYQTLHMNCVELVQGVEEFLDDNPEADIVNKKDKVRAIIRNRGDEYFYRSMARIREFLFLYYYQNAQCISHKVVDSARQQFSEKALGSGELKQAFIDDLTGVSAFYCLALNHMSALHTIYHRKINDRDGRRKSLETEACRIVNGYYSLVSGLVSLAHSERLRLKEVTSEDESDACSAFIRSVFNTCLDSLRENGFLRSCS